MQNLQLRPEKITETTARLTRRIEERFGARGLAEISREVYRVGTLAEQQSQALGKPFMSVRVLAVLSIGLLVALMLFVFVTAIPSLVTVGATDAAEWLSSVDAGIEQLAAVGIAVVFKQVSSIRKHHAGTRDARPHEQVWQPPGRYPATSSPSSRIFSVMVDV